MTSECLNSYAMKVSQASKTELVVLTYEIAVTYIDDAISFYKNKDIEKFRESISKSRIFINQLSSVLDLKFEQGINLMKIYIFINKALNKADIKLDITELPRIIAMLNKLKSSFKAVGKEDMSGPIMQNAQQVYSGLTYSKNLVNENTYIYNKNRGYRV